MRRMASQEPGTRVYEVDEVVSALERVITQHTRAVYIRGEVVNLRSGRDGRIFWFRLEDPRDHHDARLDCMAFSTDIAQGHVLSDGGVVQALARTEFSRRDGRLVVRLRRIEPAGEGEILRMIEERRERLAAEGLFDPALKRPVPFVPRGVGLVTAAAGAARADVLRRIEDRFPVPVVVAHAAMQGPACAEEVVAAIAALDADPRVDVIVVARGGGSLQDLLPFSDEQVVRAIRASGTPVVAGIGHQPDVTLACLAADVVAATPTAAADVVVPDGDALRDDLRALGRRVRAGAVRARDRARGDLRLLGARPGLLHPHRAVVHRRREAVAGLAHRMAWASRGAVATPARDLATLGARRHRAIGGVQAGAAARLAVLSARLGAGDPGRPLAEGFALVRDARGAVVTSAAAARSAGRLTLEFGDGTVGARVGAEEDA